MNKYTWIATGVALTLACCTANAAQHGAEFDLGLTGRVTMQGAILTSACDIEAGDGYQRVDMPVDSHSQLRRNGEGNPAYFSVYLTRCSLDRFDIYDLSHYVKITFEGEEDNGMFRVEGNSEGVALELRDKNGEVIRPGKAMSYAAALEADNRFDYQFRLRQTLRDIVAGDYHAIIRYRVDYF